MTTLARRTIISAFAVLALLLLPGTAAASSSADFNGDGHPDLAVGIPWNDLPGHANAGAVQILYGGPHGLRVSGNQNFTEDTPGIGGPGATSNGFDVGDLFGAALATGDFNGDGYSDVAIGAPGKTVGDKQIAGAVYVLYGGRSGLRPKRHRYLTEATPGVKTTVLDGEHFGKSLAAARLVGDSHEDLAIGASAEVVPERANAPAGSVHVIPGGPSGLRARHDRLLESFSGNFNSYRDGKFGAALAVGDLDGDGHADLAVGAPFRGPTDGAVAVFYQRSHQLTKDHERYITEDSPGLKGPGSNGNAFGSSFAIGHFNRGRAADLAVGAPDTRLSDHIGSYAKGAVHILYGSTHGILSKRNDYLTEASKGMRGQHGQGSGTNNFGATLAAGRFNGDHYEDLAIGAPVENVLGAFDGAVHVLYGARHRLTLNGDQYLTEMTPALADGGFHDGDALGSALSTGDFNGDGLSELVIDKAEIGDDDLGGCHNAGSGVIHVLSGAPRRLQVSPNQTFSQDTPGMLGDGGQPCDQFGVGLPGGG